jgi:transposase-like protein
MVTGATPDCITTDGHDAYVRVIRTVFGAQVTHRTNCYLSNRLSQDHRGIKNAIVPHAASKPLSQLHASVVPLMSSARFSALIFPAINPSRLPSAGTSIRNGLPTRGR